MELIRLLETIRSPYLDAVIGFITWLGEETLIMIVICAVYWCISKRAAYSIGIAFFFSGLTVQGMKICFRIERPWIKDPTLTPVPSAIENATGYSFPSGHTQSAASFFGSLGAMLKKKPIKITCFAIIILVAFSRLYLGVHTLIDVVASILISLLLVLLTARFFSNNTSNKKRDLILALIMVGYTIAVIVIALLLYSSGKIEQGYVSDCMKAAGAGVGFAIGMFVERVYIDFSTQAKSVLMQAVKLLLGLAGILVIKEGLKLIIGTSLIADTIRYFLMPIWLAIGYPLIIKRYLALVPCNT